MNDSKLFNYKIKISVIKLDRFNLVNKNNKMDDIDLLDGINTFDSKAFKELFYQMYGQLYAYGKKYIVDFREVEDIVIIVLNSFLKNKGHFDSLTQVKKYLYQSVKNGCIDFLRHQKRLKVKQNEYFNEKINDSLIWQPSDAERIDAELILELGKKIENLPEKSKMVLKLLYGKGMSYQEVAEKMCVTISTVSNQRAYALKLLRLGFNK